MTNPLIDAPGAARAQLLAGMPVSERRLELAGMSTAVLEGGTGAPVVLLHGPMASAVHWARVIPALAARHRVVAPDLPGHGASDAAGPLDAERVLAWLDELIAQTCASPPVVVGHVVGGAIAVRHASAHPGAVRALVLVDATGLTPFQPAPGFAQALGAFLARPDERSHDALWRHCAHDLDGLKREMGRRWQPFEAYNVERASSAGVRTSVAELMAHFGQPQIPDATLGAVAVPVTLIWGRHDPATPLEVAEAASRRHGWRLHVIEDANDDPPVERPGALLRALESAIAGETTPAPALAAALGPLVDGPVLRAGDPGWDRAVQLWNAMAARIPALVVQPATARDVGAAIAFARARRLPLCVKGGGHNIAGSAIAEGGLLLDMSRMRDVVVDAAARLAHVGPGCLLGDVDRATQAHGLATVLGFFSEVGVAGLTLGGGLGYLTRRFGWTVDNLEEVEIVTADGAIRTASRREHPELFWAVRGGGGNFGVVTRFTFRLHEVGPMVHGGLIAWPFERADEILLGYRSLTEEAPPELSAWLMLLRAPPAPFVPPGWRGQRVCAMSVCYTGDLARSGDALAPIRALGPPVFDLLRDLPYTELQSHLDATEPKGRHYYWKTEFAAALPDELLSTWRELAADCPIPEAQLGFLHLGGSLDRYASEDGAVGNRDARYALGAIGGWEAGDPQGESYRQWVREAWQRFRRFSTGGNYVNFQTADEDEARLRASYRASYDRLLELKRRYDPENVFRANRNIDPQVAASGSGEAS